MTIEPNDMPRGAASASSAAEAAKDKAAMTMSGRVDAGAAEVDRAAYHHLAWTGRRTAEKIAMPILSAANIACDQKRLGLPSPVVMPSCRWSRPTSCRTVSPAPSNWSEPPSVWPLAKR